MMRTMKIDLLGLVRLSGLVDKLGLVDSNMLMSSIDPSIRKLKVVGWRSLCREREPDLVHSRAILEGPSVVSSLSE